MLIEQDRKVNLLAFTKNLEIAVSSIAYENPSDRFQSWENKEHSEQLFDAINTEIISFEAKGRYNNDPIKGMWAQLELVLCTMAESLGMKQNPMKNIVMRSLSVK